MAENEIRIIQCPTQESFEFHLTVMKRIAEIESSNGCRLKWNILSKKDRTIVFEICRCSRNHQKSEAETKLFQMQKILKEFEIPA